VTVNTSSVRNHCLDLACNSTVFAHQTCTVHEERSRMPSCQDFPVSALIGPIRSYLSAGITAPCTARPSRSAERCLSQAAFRRQLKHFFRKLLGLFMILYDIFVFCYWCTGVAVHSWSVHFTHDMIRQATLNISMAMMTMASDSNWWRSFTKTWISQINRRTLKWQSSATSTDIFQSAGITQVQP